MGRRPIIAGNWKMHMTRQESAALAKDLAGKVGYAAHTDVVLCPVYTSIEAVAAAIRGTQIGLGAQNVHFEEKGAFTGEISGPMLVDLGVQYAIIGHSERRQYFNETDESINKKAQALYKHGITPIICVGELLAEREGNQTEAVLTKQVNGCLTGLPADKVAASVIAYEPVWAIGTGKVASKEQAQEAHAIIRGLVAKLFSQDVADAVRIQYGGSVKPDNVKEIMAQPDVDGALVGGAALQADSFAGIINFQ